MKSQALTPYLPIIISEGHALAGERGICVDPEAIPDGQPDQRKIEVELYDEGSVLVLPRQVEVDTEALIGTYAHREQQEAADSLAAVAALPVAPAPATVAVPVTQASTAPLEVAPVARKITDPMDPALDAYRPRASVVDDYISRIMPGGYTDIDLLLHLREQRSDDGYSPNVALVGETQSGKTIFVEVLAVIAAERDGLPKPYPVFTLNGSTGITNYDLYGKTTAIQDEFSSERLVWMNGLVQLAVDCGGFLYLDEWNAVPPGQQVAVHSLLDDRRQFSNTHKPVSDGHGGFRPEIVKAHNKLWVLSTINPQGYRGTQALSEATSNRFRWLEWGYDEKVEKEIITSSAVYDLALLLRSAHKSNGGAMSTPVGSTALFRLNEDIANFGVEMALWSFLGLFQDRKDRIQVEEIIETQNFVDRLSSEYPTPLIPA